MATQRKTPIRRHNKTNKPHKKYINAGGPKHRRRPNVATTAENSRETNIPVPLQDQHSPIAMAAHVVSPRTPSAIAAASKSLKTPTSTIRKSTRNSALPIITQLNIGTPGPGYTASNTRTEFKKSEIVELKEKIALMNDGPYTISIPIPPQRHAILINIDTAAKQIRVCDWAGEKNRYFGDKQIVNKTGKLVKNPKYIPTWQLYSELIHGLEAKFPEFAVEYYPIDQELYEVADEKCKIANGGGCSEYVYSWIAKHLPEYRMIAYTK